MFLTTLIVPPAALNLLSTAFDIRPLEIHSSASVLESLIERSGASISMASFLTGLLAVQISPHIATLTICCRQTRARGGSRFADR